MSDSETAARRCKILLATDLTSKSDRALDRAVLLARQWNAHLVVVHALKPDSGSVLDPRAPDVPSWRQAPDRSVAVERRIRRDLRGENDKLSVIVEEGEPVKVVLEAIEREGCDLVVLGTAGEATLGRVLLGNTADHLVRRAPVSVLIVKNRPDGPYRHILVGTDFTPESRHGLQVAAGSFGDAIFALMHAYWPLYSRLTSDTALGGDVPPTEAASMQAFLEESGMPDAVRARIHPVIEYGQPEIVFRNYVEERGADLTVIGAFGRGLMFHLLVGGNAPRIVGTTPSDVLVVRAQRLAP